MADTEREIPQSESAFEVRKELKWVRLPVGRYRNLHLGKRLSGEVTEGITAASFYFPPPITTTYFAQPTTEGRLIYGWENRQGSGKESLDKESVTEVSPLVPGRTLFTQYRIRNRK